jgi:hypothetical protein
MERTAAIHPSIHPPTLVQPEWAYDGPSGWFNPAGWLAGWLACHSSCLVRSQFLIPSDVPSWQIDIT